MSLLSQASLVVTPNGYKEGKLYSVIPSDGSGDMSVVRATTATRVNSAGLVELVPYNLLTYSEQFENGAWAKANLTVTANTTSAPNGTTTAETLTEDTANIRHAMNNSVGISSLSGIHTASIYFKNNTRNFAWIQIATDGAAKRYTVVCDLVNGTITSTTTVGSPTSISNSITNVGNGWYRVSISSQHNSGTVFLVCGLSNLATPTYDANGYPTYLGNGTSSIYAWGAQLVEGSTALPYQKTETRLNIPRLDYSNGTCPSLLVEPQRTNVLQRSQEFDNAYWVNNGVTITANNTTAPDGTLTADRLTGVSGGFGVVRFSTWSATNNTASCFAKKNTSNIFRIANVTGTVGGVNFDLNSGVVSSVSFGFSATIEDFGNGWYRCTAVDTVGRTGTFSLGVTSASESVFIWGAQLESGSYSTSYIPTTSASVTRNADNIELLNSAILPTSYPFTMFVDAKYSSLLSFFPLSFLNTASPSNYFAIRFEAGRVDALIRPNTTEIALISSSTFTEGQAVRVAVKVESASIKLFVNGQLEASATNTVLFNATINDLFIGRLRSSADTNTRLGLNAAAIWDTALTDDELERLTGTGFNTYAEMANYYNYITQ